MRRLAVVIDIGLVASGLWFYATTESVDMPAIPIVNASGQVTIDSRPQENVLYSF